MRIRKEKTEKQFKIKKIKKKKNYVLGKNTLHIMIDWNRLFKYILYLLIEMHPINYHKFNSIFFPPWLKGYFKSLKIFNRVKFILTKINA